MLFISFSLTLIILNHIISTKLLKNQYILITGASKGIGKATALHLDRKGFHVFAGVRKQDDYNFLIEEGSTRLQPVFLDVTNSRQINETRLQIENTVGDNGLMGLVNNAGVAVGSPLEFIPIQQLRNQLEINVIGQVAVTQAFLPLIRKVKGRIINISSIAGKIATPMNGAYHASKFALEAINDTLRLELKEWEIKVISIQPGAIATPIWDTAINLANKIQKTMPKEFDELYGNKVEKAKKNAKRTGENGISPLKVAKVIEKALLSKRPKYNYLVGRDAKFVVYIIMRLPKRLRDRLILSN